MSVKPEVAGAETTARLDSMIQKKVEGRRETVQH